MPALLSVWLLAAAQAQAAGAGSVPVFPADQGANRREFVFTYRAVITGLKPGESARIWIPVPPSNEDQQVAIVARHFPADASLNSEPVEGNRMFYLKAAADGDGTIPLEAAYRVLRKEVQEQSVRGTAETGDPSRFLRPNARVPVGGKPLQLLAGRELPHDQLALGHFLYELVDDSMRYSKEGMGWGQGDAVWACENHRGNCSDFHSLFLSLARSQKIPATFEIGFPLPEQHGQGEVAGYHCWAKFKPQGRGWIPVDISEANKHPGLRSYYFGHLSPDRVCFSVGRDLVLAPRQSGPPLNFFVYPYVEVGGKPYPDAKIQRRFTYQDVGPAGR